MKKKKQNKVKEFFKPTIGKIILTIVLIVLSIIIAIFFLGKTGFPLDFFYICFIAFTCSQNSNKMYWFNLLIDILFWYIISSLLILIYNKVRKK